VALLLSILLNNIAPIFLIILVGYIIGKKFPIDIRTLTKINIYVYVPALIFVKISETKITKEMLGAIGFAVLLMAAMNFVSMGASRIRKNSPTLASAMKNSILFYNSGNLGLPLIMLLFDQAPEAVSIQVMVLLVQNLSTYTIGLYNANRGKMTIKDSLKQVLRMPSVYALFTAFLFKLIRVDLTQAFFWPAAVFINNGLISIALLTLGVQLTRAKMNFKNPDVYIASFLRLFGGPTVAYLLICLFGIEGIMAKVLLISSSVPTAVNTSLIAVEFHNEPDFASQVVLTTTLLSAMTMSVVIFIAQWLF
jgi:predicted permease